MVKNNKKLVKMKGDNAMQVVSSVVLVFILIIVAYPVIYVISCSFSSGDAVSAGRVLLWPVEFTLSGYEFVLQYRPVWIGFRNSILYTISGLVVTMTLTVFAAYPLSRPHYQGRKPIMAIFFVTMLFGAGLIPSFLINSKLGLVGSPLAVILSGSINVYNMIVLRTAFCSVPQDLFDAAEIDGANDFHCLYYIALPLAKATLGVLCLYSVVGSWNDYFSAMIYLRDSELYPLQLILRNMLTSVQQLDLTSVGSGLVDKAKNDTEQIQYALIVIATVPVMAVYAAVQKSFEKGVMIGSVKG